MARLSPAKEETDHDSAPRRERGDRRPVDLCGHLVRADGAIAEISVLDLSYNGCGIAIAEALAPGESVKLSVLRRGTIEAEVRWCSDGKAGLVFDPEPEPRAEHPRRRERVPFSAEVTAKRLGSTRYLTRIFDASPEGCSIEIVDRPAVGEIMLVKFKGLEAIEARVCWVKGPSAGLRFANPIHPAVFDLMARRLGA